MANESRGWICLYRSITESPIWTDKPFSKGQAWVDLLLLANHEDTKQLYEGRIVTFKRGTVNRSILSLADRWGWDRKKVRNFLKFLEVEQMATTESTTHGTTITLVNYGAYQDCGTTKGTTVDTTIPQPLPQPFPINNNENNENNDNKDKRERVREKPTRHKHGSYNNVLLSDEEFKKLQAEFPADWESRIERLSEYMKSSGKSYKDHLATIRSWSRRDNGSQSNRKQAGSPEISNKQREGYKEFNDIFKQ